LKHLRLALLLCLTIIGGTTYSAPADPYKDMFGSYGDYFKDPFGRRKDDEMRRLRERRADDERREEELLKKEDKNEDQVSNSPDTDTRSDKDSYAKKDDMIPKDDKKNKFTGADFDASTFIDTDFSRQSFMDSLKMQPPPDDKSKALMTAAKPDKFVDDGGGAKSDQPLKDVDLMEPPKGIDLNEWKEVMTMFHSYFADWVPSKPDPTAMGSFGKFKDNGRPVPYNLNGHPDPERGIPWEKSD